MADPIDFTALAAHHRSQAERVTERAERARGNAVKLGLADLAEWHLRAAEFLEAQEGVLDDFADHAGLNPDGSVI